MQDELLSRINKELSDEVSQEKKRELIEEIEKELDNPVRIIGAGQTGVGKSTLLKSVFAIDEDDPNLPKWLKDLEEGATEETTKEFNHFQIETDEGFKIELTDGPGLGASMERDEELIPKWIEQIQKNDILYWVLDASSRDIAHIQRNMKKILDETGYRDRLVVVLNKVDKIELPPDKRKEGKEQWNTKYNLPTDELEDQIEKRTNDVINKLSEQTGISDEQVVVCSALKRWNNDVFINKLADQLPPTKKLKILENRDINDFTELMSEDAKQNL